MSAKLRVEDGLVIGTAGDKYQSRNPLARRLVAGFDRAVAELAAQAGPASVIEFGCGEGHTLNILMDVTKATVHATDISATCIADARANLAPQHRDRVTFGVENLMTAAPPAQAPDLVVCCEVLEHLDDPRAGMERLVAQRARAYLLSVPREPIWRILNFARGAYMREWGNSPGHLNHWSRRGFLRFVGGYMRPVAVRSPLPWTVVLCTPHER